MTLLTQITEDWKQAMRDKNDLKKTILNFVLAQIKYKKIELQKDPEDGEIIQIIKKEIKALNESIGFLEKSDKPEELEEELQKRVLLEFYLPQTFSKEKTAELVNQTITELGITELKTGRGQVTKALMAQYKGEIDGSIINEVINNLVNN